MDNLSVAVARRDDAGPVIDGVLPGRMAMGRGFHTVRPHGVPEWVVLHTVAGGGRLRQLGRTMKAATGMSVMAAVERVRMDAARELLDHADLTAAQVATRVGYPDPLYFSRRFRRDSGLSPRAWRRRAGVSPAAVREDDPQEPAAAYEIGAP